MIDGFGRIIEYLRVSVTDKCNLRCRYCMPPEGVSKLSHSDILTIEEITRICALLCEMGVRRVRFTGGEPLIRKGITDLIHNLSSLDNAPEILMTTNGVLLAKSIKALYEAGLAGVNISLDTTDRNEFLRMTGSDLLSDVINSINAAYETGIRIKINCVPITGINDKEIPKIAEFARNRMIDVRFIELMPIGCAAGYDRVTGEGVLHKIIHSFGLSEGDLHPDYGEDSQNGIPKGPALYYRIKGFAGRIGLIDPISDSFCDKCNRIRLTSTGQIKPCLYFSDSIDLRKLIRDGCTDEDIKEAVMRAIAAKPREHRFGIPDGNGDSRKMYQIGG